MTRVNIRGEDKKKRIYSFLVYVCFLIETFDSLGLHYRRHTKENDYTNFGKCRIGDTTKPKTKHLNTIISKCLFPNGRQREYHCVCKIFSFFGLIYERKWSFFLKSTSSKIHTQRDTHARISFALWYWVDKNNNFIASRTRNSRQSVTERGKTAEKKDE